MLLNERSHGRDPRLPLEALESTLQCFLDFWKALVVALQGVAAGTYRVFYIAELGAGYAPAGWCIV